MPTFTIPRRNPAQWNKLLINNKPLPGTVQRVEVGGDLRMDTEGIAGKDGVVIANADWSEDSASFELLVMNDELERMREFRETYKNKPGIKPVPVNALHPLKNRVPVTVELTNITPKKDKNTQQGQTVKPTAVQPGQRTGLAESDEIINQPAPGQNSGKPNQQPAITQPKPPGLPAPARK
jgi:hypothetical protein